MAADGASDLHSRLAAVVLPLGPTRSTLRNGISSHVVADAITLTQMDRTHAGARQLQPRLSLLLGSVDKQIRVSACLQPSRTAPPPAVRHRKRGRVSESERKADEVVAGVRRRLGSRLGVLTATQLEIGHAVVRQLVELRGSGGERVLEAVGLSATDPQHVADQTDGRPALVLSARLAPGVAVSLADLRAALAPCSDGALTTMSTGLAAQYSLPAPVDALDPVASGQAPIFLHAAVPLTAPAATPLHDAR